MGLFGFGSSKPKLRVIKNCWYVRCDNCGREFPVFRSRKDWPSLSSICPSCGGKGLFWSDRYWRCNCGEAHFVGSGDDYTCERCGTTPDRTYENL